MIPEPTPAPLEPNSPVRESNKTESLLQKDKPKATVTRALREDEIYANFGCLGSFLFAIGMGVAGYHSDPPHPNWGATLGMGLLGGVLGWRLGLVPAFLWLGLREIWEYVTDKFKSFK